MTSHGKPGHVVALLLLYEEEGGSWVGEVRKVPNPVFSEVTFDFGYSPINTLNELAASEWDAQPLQHIAEPFFMVLNV